MCCRAHQARLDSAIEDAVLVEEFSEETPICRGHQWLMEENRQKISKDEDLTGIKATTSFLVW